MAVPKKKPSKSKARKRRTHYKLKKVSLSNCNNCGASKISHTICPTCGYYKGAQVLEV